jgi:hypothetical protein
VWNKTLTLLAQKYVRLFCFIILVEFVAAANRISPEGTKNECFRTRVRFNKSRTTNRFSFDTFGRIRRGFTKIINTSVRKPLLILVFPVVILLEPISI